MKLREEEFYEQYHQHGGTTIIPTEIFNELYDDATEEIERLNGIIEIKTNRIQDLMKRLSKRTERIEKAIKYIENNQLYYEDYDYDINDEMYLAGIDDKRASEDLINILQGSDKD